MHVNLVDLVLEEGPVHKFKTVKELSEYTRATGKFFPRDDAEAGGLLRYLLRHIFDPSKDSDRIKTVTTGSFGRPTKMSTRRRARN